tara:strand:+ start:52 stop:540 length:489 start_codon:yes stop_codon:yes gene_type:complete
MENIRQINKNDNEKIFSILEKSFGPGRFARSVYRLREIVGRETEFSYVYEKNNKILSSISYYQTFLTDGLQGLLLGPLAVDPEYRGKGFGVALVEHTISLIKKQSNYDFIIAIGDNNYYEKFGFKKIDINVKFFGPVNKEKILILDINQKIKKNEYTILELS